MTALLKWAPGAFATWSTSAQAGFASSDLSYFGSLGSGSVVVGSLPITNSSNLDLIAEVAVSALSSTAPTAGMAWCDVYLLPLGPDGVTYGDGTPSGGPQSVPPGASYKRRTISIRPPNNFSANSTPLVGVSEPFALPRGDFVLAIGWSLGFALASAAAASVSIRTTVENTNG